jgi:TRAP-type C4-dicarboxylate transport system substrate-binding protein
MQRIASMLAATGLVFAAAASSQTKWDMPTPYADNIFHTVNNKSFIEDVKKATGGQLEVTLHSNASLIKHPDILRAVQSGQVPAGEILLSQFGNEDPMFEAESLPFFATGFDNAAKFYLVHRTYVEKAMQKKGVRVLYSVPWPGQAFFTKEPLKSIDGMKGVKFRAYSPITARIAELVGAVPTTVQAAEVSQAFATGIVSAMITSAATGVSSKAWEFSKYYYDANAFHPRNVVIVNERAFQRLPEAQRNALLKAAGDAEKRGWDMARQNQASTMKILADNGMTIVQPDAAMTAALAKVGDTMLNEWLKKAGPDGEAMIKAYRNAGTAGTAK